MTTKEHVLHLLNTHIGEHLSGAEIARTLSVSRNAVWKAINALREEGYEISAVTNRGYSLTAPADQLTPQSIAALLSPETQHFAEMIQVHPSLVSTNQTAKELAVSGAPHGTTVIAETQTGGRGRYTREFYSPAGGLYMSVILHPALLHFSQITAVTAFAANAVCEAVTAVSGREPRIKWVNDIYLGGKKICGILTEGIADLESGGLSVIVLGIGLNISAEFPPALRKKAGSLFPDGAASGMRSRLAAELLNRLLGWSEPPQESDIFAAYRSRMMLPEKPVTVVQGQTEYQARVCGIDSEGHLIVETADGMRRTLLSGEIRNGEP